MQMNLHHSRCVLHGVPTNQRSHSRLYLTGWHSQVDEASLQVRVLMAALDASVLFVLAVMRAHASVRALQQVAFTARAAHVVQQDR